jgi:hypothetical protein
MPASSVTAKASQRGAVTVGPRALILTRLVFSAMKMTARTSRMIANACRARKLLSRRGARADEGPSLTAATPRSVALRVLAPSVAKLNTLRDRITWSGHIPQQPVEVSATPGRTSL